MSSPRFVALLSLQDLDTTIDQLCHRRETLPERSELEGIDGRSAEAGPSLAEAVARRDEVSDRLGRLEDDLASTESRIEEVNRRLYGGSVSASRELLAMSSDVESLRARASSLEDQVLGVMEEREPLDAEVEALASEVTALSSQRADVAARLGVAESELDSQITEARGRRHEASRDVPGDLLDTYERLRARLAGVGAARLIGQSCSGCHLTLAATELDRIRHQPPDVLTYCEQCGRILVLEQ
jgi:predicted  nucleic acid-binding Zn-ribbon protein